MRSRTAAFGAACIVVLGAAPALAHVTVKPSEAIAGGFQTFVVQVPNERDDASTVKVQVEFPPVFASVSFQDKEGWKRKVKTVQFDEPIEAFGEEVTEGVGQVTWSGGEIEPGEFETFAFSVGPLPEGEIVFPALQTYDSGEVVRWIGPADADAPAAHVNAIDLGLEEGQGELSAIAAMGSGTEHAAPEETAGGAEEGDGDGPGVLLGSIGIGLGALALVVAMTKKKT